MDTRLLGSLSPVWGFRFHIIIFLKDLPPENCTKYFYFLRKITLKEEIGTYPGLYVVAIAVCLKEKALYKK